MLTVEIQCRARQYLGFFILSAKVEHQREVSHGVADVGIARAEQPTA
jgi:hypothetical protein